MADRIRVVLIALSLLVAIRVAAQEFGTTADTAAAAKIARLPNPSTATWVSVGFTVVPALVAVAASTAQGTTARYGAILGIAGLVIGPATGYWYGDAGGKAMPGLLLRAGGLALVAAGAFSCVHAQNVAQPDLNTDGYSCSGGTAAAIVGGALFLGGTVYDFASVEGKVRAHNAAEARAMIVPLFYPSERRVGVGMVVGF